MEGMAKPPPSRNKVLSERLKEELKQLKHREKKIKKALRHLKKFSDAADFHAIMAETRHYHG